MLESVTIKLTNFDAVPLQTVNLTILRLIELLSEVWPVWPGGRVAGVAGVAEAI